MAAFTDSNAMAKRDIKKDTLRDTRAKMKWGITGILALLVVTSFYVAPTYANRGIDAINNTVALGLPRFPETGFKLGLDLQGGASLIYKADVSAIDDSEKAAAVEGVRDVVERRVNAIGVGEPSVRTAKVGGDYRINVELPGVEDVNQAIAMIGETPTLEFKEPNNEPPRELTPEEEAQLEAYNTDARERADDALNRIEGGESFEDVARDVSEDQINKNNGGNLGFVSKNGIDSALYEWVKDADEGEITSELIETPQGLNILKRGATREGETFVSASHILICSTAVLGCESGLTPDEAKARAEEIYQEANADNFADLAKEYSNDPGTAEFGGVVGTFGRNEFIPAFENAVFDADVGQILGPVETDLGYHVIYKTGEDNTEYELSRILITLQTEEDYVPTIGEWKNTELSGAQLERAEVVSDPNTGAVQVSLTFNAEGADLFKEITERNIGRPVAIFLDGVAISVPTVQAIISNGQAVITGDSDIAEARLLAQRLNAGALPVPVELISQQTIGASLGAESLAKSLQAGSIGLILVMIFMVAYYRLPGVLSVIALGLYMSLTLAIFKLMGVTLSLAGIAGLILSIGMAVDANVLIFERLKEELKKGRTLKIAVEEGFLRAWTSIRDGNISTLITCGLLIGFGSSFVQGFAITLAIGVLISMFSAITVTRMLLRFVIDWFPRKGSVLFLGAQKEEE